MSASTAHSSLIDKQKLLRFLLIDAINDDSRCLYELRYDVTIPFEDNKEQIDFEAVSNALTELLREEYISVELLTIPDMRTVQEISSAEAITILSDPGNWLILDGNQAYAVSTMDGERTVQLENELYKELQLQGLRLK